MTEKKEIKINSLFLKDVFKSVLYSLIILFVINHFGEFRYKDWVGVDYYVTYETKFGKTVYSDTNIFTSNKSPQYGEVETYFEKLPYYIYSTISDYITLPIFIILFLLILVISRKFDFKIV